MLKEEEKSLKEYTGGCHCKAVRFKVKAPTKLLVWKCNCSVCWMRQNHHFIVPKAYFTLLSGENCLTTYQFNTKVAIHKFCKICGIQSFYHPRSNPDGYAVTIYCIDKEQIDMKNVVFQEFDGINWENSIKEVQADIGKLSKQNYYEGVPKK